MGVDVGVDGLAKPELAFAKGAGTEEVDDYDDEQTDCYPRRRLGKERKKK